MCSSISWYQFIFALFFLALGYYLVVIILKYRKDIFRWVMVKVQGKPDVSLFPHQEPTQPERGKPVPADAPVQQRIEPVKKPAVQTSEAKIYTAVHELTHDLHVVFTEYASRKKNKPELLGAIRRTLSDYVYLQGTYVEPEIIQHIAVQAKEICSIEFNKDELNMLWKE